LKIFQASKCLQLGKSLRYFLDSSKPAGNSKLKT
jgi:hypothetical protein